MSPVAVLTGPPGAGKSTVGSALAERLGVPFVDTDALVEQRAGMAISDIFVDLGEAHFRSLERAAVADAIGGHEGVVALGGGAILDPDTQALLAGQRVVFLDVSLRHAARRSGFDQGRPLLALNPRGQWLQLMADRRPIYERLTWLRVDTDEKAVDAITEEIVSALETRSAESAPTQSGPTPSGSAGSGSVESRPTESRSAEAGPAGSEAADSPSSESPSPEAGAFESEPSGPSSPRHEEDA